MDKGLRRSTAITDDDVLVRQALEDCMESAGDVVEGFSSGEKLLTSGCTRDAACLVIDIQLPGINGLEFSGEAGRRR
jgi:FixJ family two-component response regulator